MARKRSEYIKVGGTVMRVSSILFMVTACRKCEGNIAKQRQFENHNNDGGISILTTDKIDIDQIGSTLAGKGPKINMIGY